jgi:DNA phosphorothioation-dependent restriction protein DptG
MALIKILLFLEEVINYGNTSNIVNHFLLANFVNLIVLYLFILIQKYLIIITQYSWQNFIEFFIMSFNKFSIRLLLRSFHLHSVNHLLFLIFMKVHVHQSMPLVSDKNSINIFHYKTYRRWFLPDSIFLVKVCLCIYFVDCLVLSSSY